MILRHELIHYKRMDIVYKFILTLVSCFYWFNPLINIMQRLASDDIELSCDDHVIQNKDFDFKENYTKSILHFAKLNNNQLLFTTCFGGTKQTIKQRLENIFDQNIKKSGKMLLLIVAILCAVSGGVFAFSTNMVELPKRNVKLPQQAYELATFYEQYGSGVELLDSNNFYMSLYYLYEAGLEDLMRAKLEDSQAYADYYSLPTEDIKEVYGFLFDTTINEAVFEEYEKGLPLHLSTDFANYVKNDIELENISCTKASNGELTCTFKRKSSVNLYNNVEYVMTKHVLDSVPNILSSKFKVGDTVYRIKQITEKPSSELQEPKTVEINTVQDFLAMAEDINTNGKFITQNTYLLNADLDFNNMEVPVIAQISEHDIMLDKRIISKKGFNGIFDGQGHTIKNIRITNKNPVDGGLNYTGLFGYVSENGVIKNLTVDNITVTNNENRSFFLRGTGAIAGCFSGKMENCHVKNSNIFGIYMVGGLVGDATGEYFNTNENTMPHIYNCSVENTAVEGQIYIGLACGQSSYASIKGCSVEGTVTADIISVSDNIMREIGGFSGGLNGGIISDCSSAAKLVVLNNATTVGAFSAFTLNNVIIENCSYDKYLAGNWDIIDAIDGQQNGNIKQYDINPK